MKESIPYYLGPYQKQVATAYIKWYIAEFERTGRPGWAMINCCPTPPCTVTDEQANEAHNKEET